MLEFNRLGKCDYPVNLLVIRRGDFKSWLGPNRMARIWIQEPILDLDARYLLTACVRL